MFSRKLMLTIVGAVLLMILLTGCPGTSVDPPVESAIVIVESDLTAAFDAGIQVDAVSVLLESPEHSYPFDLFVDATAQIASGSENDVAYDDYTATITVKENGSVIGHANGNVAVRADTTITVDITVTVADETGGSVEIGVE